MKNTDYEVGKVYFLFAKQFNATNRVRYLGKTVWSSGNVTHRVEYAGRGENPEWFTVHDFELESGQVTITKNPEQGQLIS